MIHCLAAWGTLAHSLSLSLSLSLSHTHTHTHTHTHKTTVIPDPSPDTALPSHCIPHLPATQAHGHTLTAQTVDAYYLLVNFTSCTERHTQAESIDILCEILQLCSMRGARARMRTSTLTHRQTLLADTCTGIPTITHTHPHTHTHSLTQTHPLIYRDTHRRPWLVSHRCPFH
jgi:hypothetical protein